MRSQRDTDFNGIPDEFCTYQHGLIHQVDWRPNGLKYTTVREVFRHGVLVEILRGGDPGGQFKERVRYGPFFNALSTHAALSPDTPR